MEANGQHAFHATALGHGSEHWAEFATLWGASASRCPFQSPAILRYFSGCTTDAKRLFALRRDGVLRAAVVLKQDASGNLAFLSDLKTDVNRFLFHKEAQETEKRAFFDGLLGLMRKEGSSLTLNSQHGGHPDTALLLRSAKDAGLFCSVVENSACPLVEAETPQALFQHVNGLRELRYRVNKLRNQQNAAFEVFTDDTDLDGWADAFCAAHVRRWAGTPTPSSFRSDTRRLFVKGCLHAWAGDGLLVRFSVRAGDERIGFVIGLRSGADTIIHHSTTYDPRFAKNSPGKALIHSMAAWMADNGLRILDFGDGREDYKYTVATGERPLHRIFIAGKGDLRYILSSSVIRLVRNNRFMYGMYLRHVKRRLQA